MRKKTVVLPGATGFIGCLLTEYLAQNGYEVIGLSRYPDKYLKNKRGAHQILRWNPYQLDGWEKVLKKADIIINLAGENISALRWTAEKKNRILNSRIQSVRILHQACEKNDRRPDLFLQVSGIHFYGFQTDNMIDESATTGDGFLAGVAQAVETLTDKMEKTGTRRILLRLGPVYGPRGGIFPKLVMPFKWFVGGRIGSGKQWISWIHYRDFCRAMGFVISQPDMKGAVNLTSPRPVQNREMAKKMGKLLKKPAFFLIPNGLIKIFLGDMGKELLLSDQRIYPKYLIDKGFEFEFPRIDDCLNDLLN